MKAIRAHYIGPTDYRGSRIRATAEGVAPLTIGYPHDRGEGEPAHRVAAEALADREGWLRDGTRLAGGQLPDGSYAFVFVEDRP